MPCTNYEGASVPMLMAYQLCAENSGANVEVSLMPTRWIELVGNTRFNFKMYLQRAEGERFNTIGTRTGYVTPNSPAFRTFTNVRQGGGTQRLRLLLDYYEDGIQTSVTFFR